MMAPIRPMPSPAPIPGGSQIGRIVGRRQRIDRRLPSHHAESSQENHGEQHRERQSGLSDQRDVDAAHREAGGQHANETQPLNKQTEQKPPIIPASCSIVPTNTDVPIPYPAWLATVGSQLARK